jgi:hypothetical protein
MILQMIHTSGCKLWHMQWLQRNGTCCYFCSSVATIQVGPSTPFHLVVTFQQNVFNCPICATIATHWFLLLQLFTGYYGKYLPHYHVIVTTNLLCWWSTNLSCSCKCTYLYLQLINHGTTAIKYFILHNCLHILMRNSSICLYYLQQNYCKCWLTNCFTYFQCMTWYNKLNHL